MAVAGSTFEDVLYGAHLNKQWKPVVLCEGETDTWAADRFLNGEMTVLGLPTGAKRPTDGQLEIVGDRTVYLAFDSDSAGNAAAEEWAKKLRFSQRIEFPSGEDLCSAGPAFLEGIL